MHDVAGLELLITQEAEDYLRIGERKLYELISERQIPCTKVTGKWLFPRASSRLCACLEERGQDRSAGVNPGPAGCRRVR
jgi:excisionase family DNA binding protein